MSNGDEDSILKTLDSVVPAPVAQFDAFPKLPSSYKSRSEERGLLTVFILFVALILLLNDIGDFFWGWPEVGYTIDRDNNAFMNVNVDITVNMPCQYLSIDLRDAVGDRLFLTSGITREGAQFDTSQAAYMQQAYQDLTAPQAIAQSRKSRGLFATLFRKTGMSWHPSYYHWPSESSCRLSGSMEVKKVTANLHITTLGHGYNTYEYVDHKLINLSHVIHEFSFGPYFPDITQPLDYTYEVTPENFIAYQYFLRIVPTTYVAPRSKPLHTNQYSVTEYTRQVIHGQGAPGIFFKFDIDPVHMLITQSTISFRTFIIRCVGVIGGVFVCVGYAVRVTYRAVDVVTGASSSEGTIAASSGIGIRDQWNTGSLRARTAKVLRQGASWAVDRRSPSPYSDYGGSFGNTAHPSYFGPTGVSNNNPGYFPSSNSKSPSLVPTHPLPPVGTNSPYVRSSPRPQFGNTILPAGPHQWSSQYAPQSQQPPPPPPPPPQQQPSAYPHRQPSPVHGLGLHASSAQPTPHSFSHAASQPPRSLSPSQVSHGVPGVTPLSQGSSAPKKAD